MLVGSLDLHSANDICIYLFRALSTSLTMTTYKPHKESLIVWLHYGLHVHAMSRQYTPEAAILT